MATTGDRPYEDLIARHWFDAVADLLADADPVPAGALELAQAARRVLDLDAEDFGEIAAAHPDRPWAAALGRCGFPTRPDAAERGALASLVPLFELILEVATVRGERDDLLPLVAVAHLIGGYLALLASESLLGHAGDPARMATSVAGEPQRWGTDDRRCAHPSALRATAKRSLQAAAGDDVAFTSYLDRSHSRLGGTLAVCVLNHATTGPGDRPGVGESCPDPCGFVLRGSLEVRRDLDARVRLAGLYGESALVQLRHHAPVGHFFGVPSAAEFDDAWDRTWHRLTAPWNDGGNPLTGVARPADGGRLPGLALLVSTVAGRPVQPSRILRGIGDDLRALLSAAEEGR